MENTKERRYKFMRLYNIYYICCVCKDEIDDNVELRRLSNSDRQTVGYEIVGWDRCKVALEQIRSISCLRERADNVYNTLSAIDRDKIKPTISPQNEKKFSTALDELKVAMETIKGLYRSLDIGESKAGIDVKIPKCESLKEYTDYLKEIDFIFTQCPYLLCHDEEIRFNNVDVGSQWLSFFLATAGTFNILNNLASIVNKAISIKSHLLILKQQEEQVRAMQMKNDVMEQTVDVFKQMKQQLLSDSVGELESEIGDLKDGEERGKVEKTLEKMVLLIDKGVEIYSSIETTNEVKALFPTNENNPILPDNIVKLLEKKEDTEE